MGSFPAEIECFRHVRADSGMKLVRSINQAKAVGQSHKLPNVQPKNLTLAKVQCQLGQICLVFSGIPVYSLGAKLAMNWKGGG
jgi:hypothetical protein